MIHWLVCDIYGSNQNQQGGMSLGCGVQCPVGTLRLSGLLNVMLGVCKFSWGGSSWWTEMVFLFFWGGEGVLLDRGSSLVQNFCQSCVDCDLVH